MLIQTLVFGTKFIEIIEHVKALLYLSLTPPHPPSLSLSHPFSHTYTHTTHFFLMHLSSPLSLIHKHIHIQNTIVVLYYFSSRAALLLVLVLVLVNGK